MFLLQLKEHRAHKCEVITCLYCSTKVSNYWLKLVLQNEDNSMA
jgi:hypothetical protein